MDADDTLPQNALEIFSQYINPERDIIIAQWQDLTAIRDKEIISIDEYRRRLIFSKVNVGACGKLVRRTLYTGSVLNLPRDIKVGEDWIMHLRLSFNTENDVLIIPNQVYCYNLNEGSVTTSFKHNIEYAAKFYPHLVESVPSVFASKYVPLITNAIITRWAVYTRGMIRLSTLAAEFRNDLKCNYRRGEPGLCLIDSLLFRCSCPAGRLPLLGAYHMYHCLYAWLRRMVQNCRKLKSQLQKRKR